MGTFRLTDATSEPPTSDARPADERRESADHPTDDPDVDPRPVNQRRALIGFGVSFIAHSTLLLVLALIVRTHPSTSTQLLFALDPSESGDIGELQLIEFSDPDLLIEEEVLTDRPIELEAMPELQLVERSKLRPPETSALPSDVDPEPAAAKPSPRRTPPDRDRGIRFFDTHAYGNKFVYVLDISGSMWARAGQRMQRARVELVRSINQLQPHHYFHVVLYNDDTYNFESPKLRPATRENKQRVARWISSVVPNGGTMPGEALRVAGQLKPDAVFFLSDGEFAFASRSSPQSDLNRFLQSFAQARPGPFQNPTANNTFPKKILDEYDPAIVVHTIAFESVGNRAIMETIAKEKDGQFRFIPEPRPGNQRRRPLR